MGFPTPPPGSKWLRLLYILFRLCSLSYADGTVSISQFSAYSVQRYCVRECLWEGCSDGNPALPWHLSCNRPYSDNCLCRTDLAASSVISSCVNRYCSQNTVDISSAEWLYSAYCASGLNPIGF